MKFIKEFVKMQWKPLILLMFAIVFVIYVRYDNGLKMVVQHAKTIEHFKEYGASSKDISCVKSLHKDGVLEYDLAAAITKYKISCEIEYTE